MPYVEVDDAIFAALQREGIQIKDVSGKVKQGDDALGAFQKLMAGPQRMDFLKAYKAAFPEASVPELDAAKPVLDEVAAVRKQFEDYKADQEKAALDRQKKREEDSVHRTVADGRKWLRGERKLDEDGVTAVENIMKDKGVADYAVAYDHWKAQQPPDPESLPNSYGSARSLDWFKADENQPDTKLLLEDPKGFQRKTTGQILQQIREGKLAA